MDNVSIFVDVQNIYYTTKEIYGRHFNYNAFWQKVTSNRKVIKAIAYGIDRGDEKQKQFQNILRGIGFELKLKPYIQRSDGSAKGDWDVGITIDILESLPALDRIFLLSGDGDFDLLVRTVQTKHELPVEVYGIPELTADSLKKVASCFHPINESLLI